MGQQIVDPNHLGVSGAGAAAIIVLNCDRGSVIVAASTWCNIGMADNVGAGSRSSHSQFRTDQNRASGETNCIAQLGISQGCDSDFFF